MKKKRKGDPIKRHIYITAAVLTLVILVLIFLLVKRQDSRIAPVYEMTVNALTAQTPEEAQAQCRSESARFKEIMAPYSDVCWVWCENGELFLVKNSALRLLPRRTYEDHTGVSFKDHNGKTHSGYIIDIAEEPNEYGRIKLESAEEYNYEQVSMSIREGLRSGKIDFEDAVYLWEKGSSEVLAVKKDCYSVIEKNIVSFTDDGGRTRTCYILDTKI